MRNWSYDKLIQEKLQVMSDKNRCINEINYQSGCSVRNSKLIRKHKLSLDRLKNRQAEIDREIERRGSSGN